MQEKSAGYVMGAKSVPPVYIKPSATSFNLTGFLSPPSPSFFTPGTRADMSTSPFPRMHPCICVRFLCVCHIEYEDRTFDSCTKNKRSLMLLITQAWWGLTITSSHSWTSSQSSLLNSSTCLLLRFLAWRHFYFLLLHFSMITFYDTITVINSYKSFEKSLLLR